MDADLRELEQAWRRSGSDVDEAAWLDARLRAGSHKSVRIRLCGRRSEACGARKQVRQIYLGEGTSCQSEPMVHFGVGQSGGPYEVRVNWPSGRVSRRTLPAGKHKIWEPRP